MITRKKRLVEWGKNLLIVLLSISAIVLITQSGLYDGAGTLLQGSGEGEAQSFVPSVDRVSEENVSIQIVRLAVQNSAGRYGVQYDEDAVNAHLIESMGFLLQVALSEAEHKTYITEEAWQHAIGTEQSWAYYELMSELPLSNILSWLASGMQLNVENPALERTASRILIAEQGGTVSLYYHSDREGAYYRMELPDSIRSRLETVANGFLADNNGASFAFEDPEMYLLPPNSLIVPDLYEVPRYEASSPLNLEEMAASDLEAFLRLLEFNPRTIAITSRSDRHVIQERSSADRLEIMNNGTILYRDSEKIRYLVEDDDLDSLLETVQGILSATVLDYCGEAELYLIGLEGLADGSKRLTFGYCLNGAKVEVYSEEAAATFVIRDGFISEFTIHVRQYTRLEETVPVMPLKMAMAVAKTKGHQGRKLLISYGDTGGDKIPIGAYWKAY